MTTSSVPISARRMGATLPIAALGVHNESADPVSAVMRNVVPIRPASDRPADQIEHGGRVDGAGALPDLGQVSRLERPRLA
jgi:hypothetical protein